MLNHEAIIGISLLVASLGAAAFFGYIYHLKRQSYLLAWAAAWLLLSFHYIPQLFDAAFRLPLGERNWAGAFNHLMLGGAGLLFLSAARLYAQLRVRAWASALVLTALGAWTLAYKWSLIEVSPYLGFALLFFIVAWTFWHESRKQEATSDRLLALAFVMWGVMLLGTVFRGSLEGVVGQEARVLVLLPQLFAAVLMVMGLYEEEKRRVERNMLALSNLNLATSSFLGGEVQKMLGQALDRVLNVVRIPSGALFLKQGDGDGPPSLVAAGLSDGFCTDVHKERLDEHLIGVVARLGGLIVFRPAASWASLEQEDGLRRFRELAMRESLRAVVGISLQAKERVFGVLLLGTPDNRRFTPAELRLLLALGHQIGMAVENSYLMQQTSRRTEELHILNEIGRALSSTLDSDALFEKIFSELQRLFDVSNFYIAFYDSHRDEVRFELEIKDNVRMPPRSRPAGNRLSEYMIRTRQPVLIRERFVEETKRLGVEVRVDAGCFCGVPLVLYDRAIGAMAVHSTQERIFDEGHLELMRVLASQAGIAIENARLFREEQKKSRHLNLLNNVSRHAITTLNPDEMLAEVMMEMERNLAYSHIGLGIMDYSSKEVVIQCEGGKRRGALNRRIALGEGLLGQVARSGQMGSLRSREKGPKPVLDDSESAIALPVVYADQLMGVLYVETVEAWEFVEEEILLLRTLADQVAGALHNALSFQKAQEQAITDGLTGVKTHRFFMEALAAEWKRSTRGGRPFSLVLVDLDHFKFVNDFHGHLAGDTVLQRIGRLLEQNCRRSDVVARYGGDEFVVLMPETNKEQAVQMASKLRACIDGDPFLHAKNLTGSFGVASFPMHGSTPQELIQVADSSMYMSKHQGGNAVSTADHVDPREAQKWKRDVLEAYLGVTLKRLFSTGPEAFDEIYRRLEQFTQSLEQNPEMADVALGGSENGTPLSQLSPAIIETITSLAFAIDAKDHYTQGHSQKVASYAVLLAEALAGEGRLSQAEVEEIRLAALLHDVGKVGIPEAILNKTGPLNGEEWEIMKTHTSLGARVLEPLRVMGALQRIIRHHHEFYDGSGYPDQLSAAQIPFGARVVAIADAFDTITSDRTYKKARSPEDALAELLRCAGAQFDPELVALFAKAMRRKLVAATVPPAEAADQAATTDAAPR